MLGRIRLLVGISIFWLALSVVSDGINTLVLPLQLGGLSAADHQATFLGLLTFVGLLTGAFIQPIAGAFSDRWRSRLGRKGFVGIGLSLILASLLFFAIVRNLPGLFISYLAIQISLSIAQAGQQGLIPDLVHENQRGTASGLKGFMDLSGAMLGFVLLGQLLGAGRSSLALAIIAGILILTYFLAFLLTPEDRLGQTASVRTNAIPLRDIFRLDLTRERDFVRIVLARFLFLLGIYTTGRFLLLFVASRLGLSEAAAAEQAGTLLAGLALITILASPLTGWLADRIGRMPLMIGGAILSGISALLLIWAANANQILLFGGLMSIGSAAFGGGSWALLADLVPQKESARYFGLANFSTAGSAAVAGLFGPLIDGLEHVSPGLGFSGLFLAASLAFLASLLPIKTIAWKEGKDVRKTTQDQRKNRADDSRLAVVSLPADPAAFEEDQHP